MPIVPPLPWEALRYGGYVVFSIEGDIPARKGIAPSYISPVSSKNRD